MSRPFPVVVGIGVAALLAVTGCSGLVANNSPDRANTNPTLAVATPTAPAETSAAKTSPAETAPTETAPAASDEEQPTGGIDKPTSTRPEQSPATLPSPEATHSVDSPSRKPFRTLRGSFEQTAVLATIYPIERSAVTSTASVRFASVDREETFRILNSLNDHNRELGDEGDTSPDGLRLIDQKARKAYLPATIRDGECLCSPAVNNTLTTYVDVTVSVTFAAPPTTDTTIDLMVPGFGTVTDVPIR